jgi:hypothetical protein
MAVNELNLSEAVSIIAYSASKNSALQGKCGHKFDERRRGVWGMAPKVTRICSDFLGG